MPTLQPLSADHAPAVLRFERENRAWFAASITDRGDAYFERFDDIQQELIAEQEAGGCAFFVLVEDDGSVVGRFNLVDIEDGSAVLGYRVAERVAGQGVATSTVVGLCEEAAARWGLHTIRAATSDDNVASQRVLAKAGFVRAEPADPEDIGGKAGHWHQWRPGQRATRAARSRHHDSRSGRPS